MSTTELPTYVPQTATGGGRPPRRLLFGMMVAVFFSGGVIGSGSTLMLINRRIEDNERHHDPARTSQRIVDELREKLALNDAQTAELERITKNHLAALDRIRRDVFFPKIHEQFKQMEEQVNAVLSDEQRAQYHAWLEEKRQRVCPPGSRHSRAGSRGASSSGSSTRARSGANREASTALPVAKDIGQTGDSTAPGL
ncbi:MAG: hypothetical protein ACREHD_19595 [Pirellulales bacterium]